MFAQPTKHDGPAGTDLHVGRPSISDGAALWRIAGSTNVLDVNSSYAYLLWARDFAETSVVAHAGDEVVGFVTGYVRPTAPDTLFVWQVAVTTPCRGQGVAHRMLDDLIDRTLTRGIRYLETTVAPSNEASINLFSALARDHRVGHARRPLFTAESFPDRHDAEELHRLGPWPESG